MDSKLKKIIATVAVVIITAIAVTLVCIFVPKSENAAINPMANAEIKEYIFDNNFSNVSLDIKDASVKIVVVKNGELGIKSREYPGDEVTVESVDGTLTITQKSADRKIFKSRNINTSYLSEDITIRLPDIAFKNLTVKSESGDVVTDNSVYFETCDISMISGNFSSETDFRKSIKADSDSGDISFSTLSTETVNAKTESGSISINKLESDSTVSLETTAGFISVSESRCDHISIKSTSGDCELSNLDSEVDIKVNTSSGDVTIKDSDTNVTDIKTESGDVDCIFLTDKIYTVDSESGNINIPESRSGGKCVINTLSGNIKVKINNESQAG